MKPKKTGRQRSEVQRAVVAARRPWVQLVRMLLRRMDAVQVASAREEYELYCQMRRDRHAAKSSKRVRSKPALVAVDGFFRCSGVPRSIQPVLSRVCRQLHLQGQERDVVEALLLDDLEELETRPDLQACLVERVVYRSEAIARAAAIEALWRLTDGGKNLDVGSPQVCVSWPGGEVTISAWDIAWENVEPPLR